MNELKNIISKYFSKDNEAITYSNIDEIEKRFNGKKYVVDKINEHTKQTGKCEIIT